MLSAPFLSPDPPSPATARPMINIFDDCAAPQIAEPTSNRTRKARKVYFRKLVYFHLRNQWRMYTFKLNWLYIFPVNGCRAQLTSRLVWDLPNIKIVMWISYLAIRYALPYHPTSDKELKSVVIRGIAYELHQQPHRDT